MNVVLGMISVGSDKLYDDEWHHLLLVGTERHIFDHKTSFLSGTYKIRIRGGVSQVIARVTTSK